MNEVQINDGRCDKVANLIMVGLVIASISSLLVKNLRVVNPAGHMLPYTYIPTCFSITQSRQNGTVFDATSKATSQSKSSTRVRTALVRIPHVDDPSKINTQH